MFRISISTCLFLLTSFSFLHSQSIVWQPTNGLYSGGVSALVTSVNGTVFAGTERGLYRSDDAGRSWRVNVLEGQSVNALMRDSAGTLYAGSDAGLFRSVDNGQSWQPFGFADSLVYDLTIQTNGLFFAAVATDSGLGLYRSSDRGIGWTALSAGESPEELFPHDVTKVDAVADNIVYIRDGGAVARSTDNGDTWCRVHTPIVLAGEAFPQPTTTAAHDIVALTDGSAVLIATGVGAVRVVGCEGTGQSQPISLHPRISVFHRMLDGSILAGTYSEGLLRTTNAGVNWERTGFDNQIAQAVHITESGDLYIGSDILGVHHSEDGGTTWMTSADGMLLASRADLFYTNGNAMVAVTESGLFRTTDKGQVWERAGEERSTITAVSVDRSGTLLIGVDGMGTISQTSDNGVTWRSIFVAMSAGVRSIASNGTTIAVAMYGEIIDLSDIQQQRLPSKLIVSNDGGATWQKVLEGVEIPSVVLGRDGVFLAAADGKEVLRSTDNGITWNAIPNAPDTSVHRLFALPDGSVFAEFTNEALWRSEDNGTTWSQLTLSPDVLVRNSEGTLFGVESGELFSSNDEGVTWQLLDRDLPGSTIALDNDGYLYTGGAYQPVYRSSGTTLSVEDRVAGLAGFDLNVLLSTSRDHNATISYTLPRRSDVRITLHDALGREVQVLQEGEVEKGRHQFVIANESLAQGVYFVHLAAEGKSISRSIAVRK